MSVRDVLLGAACAANPFAAGVVALMTGADVAKMSNYVDGAPNIFELIASPFKKVVKRIGLQSDEEFEDNVKFIEHYVQPPVEISKDLPPIHERTALEVGDSKLLQEIDAEMKAAMLEAVKAVKKAQEANGGYLSWRKLQQIFDGNPVYHADTEKDVQNYDSIVKDETYFKLDDAPSLQAMEEAEKLMRKVVDDQHIWDSLKINRETIKTAFGSEGVEVKHPLALLCRSERCAHIAIDIGVVRFPRPEDPFFKLYRLRVIVFKSETAIGFVNNKQSGIFVEFRERAYKMTSTWNEKFTQQLKEAVSAQFDKAMSDLLGGFVVEEPEAETTE